MTDAVIIETTGDRSIVQTVATEPVIIETTDQQAVIIETAAEQGPPGPVSATGMQWQTTQW